MIHLKVSQPITMLRLEHSSQLMQVKSMVKELKRMAEMLMLV